MDRLRAGGFDSDVLGFFPTVTLHGQITCDFRYGLVEQIQIVLALVDVFAIYCYAVAVEYFDIYFAASDGVALAAAGLTNNFGSERDNFGALQWR